MSIAFILYCVWIAAVAGINLAPARHRPVLRFGVLAAAVLPVTLAALTVGWVPALIALCGVVALFPATMAALARYGVAQARSRIGALRDKVQTQRHGAA